MIRIRGSAWFAGGLIFLALSGASPRDGAAAVLRHAKNFVFAGAETIHDDLYAAGSVVDIQGTVDGDLVVAGQTITIGGVVTGDVIAAGRDITISGSVGGSVRATGSVVTVDGTVGHDVLAGCANFVTGPHASVGRDALVGAGTASFGGRIARDVRAGAGSATFSGSVGGTVYANSKEIRLADGAVLERDLFYTSRNALSKAPGATVRGKVEQRVPQETEHRRGPLHSIMKWIRGIVGFAILGLLFYLLVTGVGRRSVEALGRAPLMSLGIGFLLAFALPVAMALLFVMGILLGGWWIAIGVLVLYLFELAVGYVVSATAVGRWLLARAGRGSSSIGWALVLGLVTLGLVAAIPYLGKLVWCAAALCGLGAIAMSLYHARRGDRAAAPRTA